MPFSGRSQDWNLFSLIIRLNPRMRIHLKNRVIILLHLLCLFHSFSHFVTAGLSLYDVAFWLLPYFISWRMNLLWVWHSNVTGVRVLDVFVIRVENGTNRCAVAVIFCFKVWILTIGSVERRSLTFYDRNFSSIFLSLLKWIYRCRGIWGSKLALITFFIVVAFSLLIRVDHPIDSFFLWLISTLGLSFEII